MNYTQESVLNTSDKTTLTMIFNDTISFLKHISVPKAISYLRCIPDQCQMHYVSLENRKKRNEHSKKYHPIKPKRGEIYNAYITEGVGSELCGNHLVIIIQNKKGNIYSDKVNVLPIEGNGNNINSNYQLRLSSSDLQDGFLSKDPSRIILTDITTIDKARLGRRIGQLKPEYLLEIGKCLKAQLEI